MAKVKIFELKNMINEQTKGGVESKDIQDFLEKSMGVKKTHSSNLEDHEVKAVKEHFIPSAKKPSEPPANKPMRTASLNSEMGQEITGGAHAAAKRSQSDTSNRPTGDGAGRKAGDSGSKSRPAGDMKPAASQQAQRPAMPMQRPAGDSTGRSQGQMQHTGGSRPSGQGGYSQQPRGGMPTGRPTDGTGRPQGQMQQFGGPRSSGQGGYSQQPRGGMPTGRSADGTGRPQGQMQQAGGPRPSGQGGYSQQPRGGMSTGRSSDGPGRPQGQMQQAGRTRPSGQTGAYQGSQGRQSYQGNNRGPAGQGGMRPQGEGSMGNRMPSYGGTQRPMGDGSRPSGQGGYSQQQRSGMPYQRPSGQGGQSGAGRPGGQGMRQGQQGYQGQRSQGGARPGGQGSQRPYQQGQRPSDGRQGSYSQDGSRPSYNRGQDGYRQSGNQGNYRGQSGQQGGGQRMGGGYNNRGFENFQKDEDDKPNYGNRSQGKKSPQSGRGNERKNFDQQILDQKVAEKNDFSNKRNRDRMNKDKLYKDKGTPIKGNHDFDDEKTINKIAPKKGQFIQPKPVEPVKEEEIKVIVLPEILTIKELADKMKMPASALVKKLFLAGKMVSINQEITYEEAEEIALEYEIIAEKEVKVNEVEELLKEDEEDPATLVKRPPVVCVMGHVDHGKTSLLDAIRKTNVTSREAGGITQHIGAYMVEVNGEKITFLDTPGHEAFTSMRMRGAQATDIAILVVAADDGVMPQTVEAISHAKAAGVQIIVAINKIDKPSANVERVKQELTEYELIAEDWGGDTIFVPVSAHTQEGISQLLEMIILSSEMAELKANPNRKARGLVIEAELDKGRGPVATILVQKGTLQVGDNVAVGSSYGKVRAMMDDKGRRVKEATPSTPVEILGLNEVPDVGEIILATESEKEARTIAEAYITQSKEKLIADTKSKLSLDGLFSQIQAGNIKELNLIIKADVQGSVEAMKQSLLKLSNDEVAVRVLHGGVGAINESDVILASTSNAIIIGFNVKPDNAAKETADREKIDIKLYKVIYNAIDDVEAAMKGMLDPVYEEKIIGHAEVRQTFKASGVGTIAGSYVTDGKIIRGSKVRIFRDNSLIHEGTLASLKRFQDDVKEVATGYECGLVFEKFNDVREGDRVELYIMAEVPR